MPQPGRALGRALSARVGKLARGLIPTAAAPPCAAATCGRGEKNVGQREQEWGKNVTLRTRRARSICGVYALQEYA